MRVSAAGRLSLVSVFLSYASVYLDRRLVLSRPEGKQARLVFGDDRPAMADAGPAPDIHSVKLLPGFRTLAWKHLRLEPPDQPHVIADQERLRAGRTVWKHFLLIMSESARAPRGKLLVNAHLFDLSPGMPR